MALDKNDIDFTLFQNLKTCDTNNTDPTNCGSVHRMLVGLKYYEQILESDKDQQAFVAFLQNEWPSYLNDNIHFVTVHSDDLELLCDLFGTKYGGKPCDIRSCTCIDRHYRVVRSSTSNATNDDIKNEENNESKKSVMFQFYQRTFDSAHCYISHLFELGYRFKKEQQEDKNDEDIQITKYFDKKLARQTQYILNQKNKLHDYFERIETTNKFTLKTGFVDGDHSSQGTKKTFLDDLFEFIFNDKARDYLASEQYDTDAVLEDIDMYSTDKNSNILLATSNDKTLMQKISAYAETYRFNEMSFSTGFVFWYWPYYASNNENETNEQKDFFKWGNVDDFGGYTQQDLYIKRSKYADFKTEILNYKNGDDLMKINDYNFIITKANGYMQSNYCKRIKAKSTERFAMRHYGIAPDSPITTQHIISLSLYCDFTKLCTSFSATFRKLHQFETLQEVKRRNANYFFMSKYLRELVEIYGNSANIWDSNDNKMKAGEQGPFYCGMSTVMLVPAFSIRLNGPTSTTKQFSVAQFFAGDRGMIIQLNNEYYAGGREQRFFYTGWISNFTSEDERFTFGGSYPLQIQSIRHIAEKKRYDVFFEPLFRFDAIVSGLDLDIDWNQRHIAILKSFIKYANEPSKKHKFDDYILDTFSHYLVSKKTLTFHLPLIDAYIPTKVKDLIFYSVNGVADRDKTFYVDDGTNTNIPRPEILNMFKKMEKLVVYSVDERGKTTYQISLKQLLRETNNTKCEITARWKDWKGKKDKRRSWLFYQDVSASIPQCFTSSLTSFTDYNKKCNDVLTIQSKQT